MKLGILYDFYLWQIGFLFVLVLLVVLEAGYRIGFSQRKHWKDADSGGGNLILTSMLGVLALILAFTYAAAVNRFDARKQAVILEASVLSTAFNSADLVVEPGRTELKQALHDYALTRVIKQGRKFTREELNNIVKKSLDAQAKLWPIITAQFLPQSQPVPVVLSLVTSSVNKVLDSHTARLAAVQDKLPLSVTLMLLLVAAASLGVAGFNAGISGRMSRWRMTAFAVVLILVMIVIQDFDRPQEGFIVISQDSLNNVILEMEADLTQ
jgi:hypothetical protein